MLKYILLYLFGGFLVVVLGIVASTMFGAGALKRHMTISGIYAVCNVKNYPVVCFMDADNKGGSMFCMPLSLAGGKCS